mmetsp:Transcript_2160/g.6446  ORF Transcript_2160/g.6446 Transcript_2160/m.6446 type:complete len:385 (-) Transcript_2160:1527-2681(-)
MIPDVLGLGLLVHGAHRLSVDQVVEDPGHRVVRPSREAAEHGAVQQQAHSARRPARELAEGDVFLVLFGAREHVALRGPVFLVILSRGGRLVVVLPTNGQRTSGASRDLHGPPALANEERVAARALVPMGLELPDVLSSLQQGLQDAIADVLVHSWEIRVVAVHQVGRVEHDLAQGSQHRGGRRTEEHGGQVAQEPPPEEVVHPPSARDHERHQVRPVLLGDLEDRRGVAGEDAEQHALLVGDRQGGGGFEPLVELPAPRGLPAFLLQRGEQARLLGQHEHQAGDVAPLLLGGAALALGGELVQLVRGRGVHHVEHRGLRLLVLRHEVIAEEGVPLGHQRCSDELLEIEVVHSAPPFDPIRLAQRLLREQAPQERDPALPLNAL